MNRRLFSARSHTRGRSPPHPRAPPPPPRERTTESAKLHEFPLALTGAAIIHAGVFRDARLGTLMDGDQGRRAVAPGQGLDARAEVVE